MEPPRALTDIGVTLLGVVAVAVVVVIAMGRGELAAVGLSRTSACRLTDKFSGTVGLRFAAVVVMVAAAVFCGGWTPLAPLAIAVPAVVDDMCVGPAAATSATARESRVVVR